MNDSPKTAINPYAAPQVSCEPAVFAADLVGLWRQGDLLVMHKQAVLPYVCLKSNTPAARSLKQRLQWQPAWIVGMMLVSLFTCLLPVVLVLGVIALFMSQQATIHIGLSPQWLAVRMQRRVITAGAFTLGLSLLVAGRCLGIYLVDEPQLYQTLGPLPGFMAIGGLLLFFSGIVLGYWYCPLFSVHKMTAAHIWIKGVHPGVLEPLEVWKG